MSQSFVERNKAWLLPVLGVMAAGVVYLNMRTFGAKPPLPGPPPPSAAPGPAAADGVPPAPPPPAPSRAPVAAGNADLWGDLRALEAPAPLLNQKDALMARGADPLKVESLTGQPAGQAPAGRAPRLEEAPPPAAAPAATAAPASVKPVPEVDFLIRNVRGSQAWLEGTGFREGQELAPGWRVKRITAAMVEVVGPGGVVRRFTNPLAAGPQEAAGPNTPRREVP